MTQYINWSLIWNILKSVEYENADPDMALIKLVELLRKAHGSYAIQNKKIIFIEQYDFLDYKWSSSIIGSDDSAMRIEKKEEFIKKIHEEQSCIKWLLDHLNSWFYPRDEMYLKVFFQRYFLDRNVSDTMKKLNLNNRSFYVAMKNAEYLAKRAWLLLKPPKAMLDLLFNGTISQCKNLQKS